MRFEGYDIDRARWQLRHNDEVLPLSRKTFDLLIYLVEHADRVVSKDEVLRALWPDSFVEESNLTQHIFLLRKALSRHQSGNKIIETVPGRGYRFAVPVEASALRLSTGGPGTGPTPSPLLAEPESAQERNGSLAHTALPPESAVTWPSKLTAERGHGRLYRFATLPILLGALLMVITGVYLAAVYIGAAKLSGRQSVTAYTQLTHDGHAKAIGGMDGSRVYFTRADRDEIAQISVSGGAEAPMQLAIKVPRCGDVSPDGSTLLIISQAHGEGPANSLWSMHLIGGSLRQLAFAVSAAWAPDGERIVYASAGGDLYIMRSDGSEKLQIASLGGYVQSLSWSPDGKIIRLTKDGLLWQISPEGSDLHQLLPGWGKAPTQWSGDWSADGSYFFVADGQIWLLGTGQDLATKRVSQPIQLTFGPMLWDRPLPSVKGKILVASGRIRRGELIRLMPRSALPEPFLGGISAEFVSFSQSRRSVAYVTYPEGRLWRADLDGKHPVQLTDKPIYPKSIRWSPDGSQIAFVDHTESNVDAIFLISSDGAGKPLRLILKDRQAETDPSWSPDGKHIAFATSPNVGASAKSDIRVFDLVSGKTAVLPASDGLLVPRWSPDGRFLAAMTLDTEMLMLLDLTSGKWTALPTGHVAFPEWSRDSKWIYFVGGDFKTAIMRIRTGDGLREIVRSLGEGRYTGTYTFWMGLDTADNPMLLRDEGTDDIYALSLEGR